MASKWHRPQESHRQVCKATEQHALSWAGEGGRERISLQLLVLTQRSPHDATRDVRSGKDRDARRGPVVILRDEHQRCQGVSGAAGDPPTVRGEAEDWARCFTRACEELPE